MRCLARRFKKFYAYKTVNVLKHSLKMNITFLKNLFVRILFNRFLMDLRKTDNQFAPVLWLRHAFCNFIWLACKKNSYSTDSPVIKIDDINSSRWSNCSYWKKDCNQYRGFPSLLNWICKTIMSFALIKNSCCRCSRLQYAGHLRSKTATCSCVPINMVILLNSKELVLFKNARL